MPHHVTQRGNNRQDVFSCDDDRRTYLAFLAHYAALHRLAILGYCLMTNHVHLLAVPPDEASLAQALGRTHYRYTQYFNRARHGSGHLWQNRFFSCALDEYHLWPALTYLEQNPVRAGLVRQPWDYPWSSAPAHAGKADAPDWLDLKTWSRRWTPTAWRDLLRHKPDKSLITRLHLCTSRGRPLARDALLTKLERTLDRRLRPLPAGRPKKPPETPAPTRRKARKRKPKPARRTKRT